MFTYRHTDRNAETDTNKHSGPVQLLGISCT